MKATQSAPGMVVSGAPLVGVSKVLRMLSSEKRLYGLHDVVSHLVEAGAWNAVWRGLTTLRFLEAKAEAGLVFELADDFASALKGLPKRHPKRRILALLGEALRRDIHFIARHPTTLFQCLWNSCWWYDCPEAERHYELSTQDRGRDPARGIDHPVHIHKILEQWRTARDERGEKNYWLRAMRPPVHPLGEGLIATIPQVADMLWTDVDAKGRFVAVTQWGQVSIWEMNSGSLQETFALADKVFHVSSPDRGRHVVINDGVGIRVWDLEQRRELSRLRLDLPRLGGAILSKNLRWLVAWGHDDRPLVNRWMCAYDMAHGRTPLWSRWAAKTLSVYTFAPVSRFLVCRVDNALEILESGTGKVVAQDLLSDDTSVVDVRTVPSGKRLASLENGVIEGHVRLLRVPSLACTSSDRWLASYRTRHFGALSFRDGTARSVAVSPSGARAVVAVGNQVFLYSTENGSLKRQGYRASDPREVKTVAFSQDGKRVVAVGWDNTKVWSARGLEGPERRLRGHSETVAAIAFTPDGKHIVSGSNDGSIKLWDSRTGREEGMLAEDAPISDLAVFPDNDRVVCSFDLGGLRVWRLGRRKRERSLCRRCYKVSSLAVDGRGECVGFGSHDGAVRVWHLNSRRVVKYAAGVDKWVSAVAVSVEKGVVIGGFDDGTLAVWRLSSTELLTRLPPPCADKSVAEISLEEGTNLLRARIGEKEYVWPLGGRAHAAAVAKKRWRRIRSKHRRVQDGMVVVDGRGRAVARFPLPSISRLTSAPEVGLWAFASLGNEHLQILKLERG